MGLAGEQDRTGQDFVGCLRVVKSGVTLEGVLLPSFKLRQHKGELLILHFGFRRLRKFDERLGFF